MCGEFIGGEFPAQMVSNAENVSIWWRHHGSIVYEYDDDDDDDDDYIYVHHCQYNDNVLIDIFIWHFADTNDILWDNIIIFYFLVS